MKKILLVISCLLAMMGLCSCGTESGLFASPTPTPIPEIDATQILSLEEASSAIGNLYTLTLDGGSAVKDGNTSTATYVSDPIGKGDPIIVKVHQFNEAVSKDDVWAIYDDDRVMRSSAELISGIGEDAFIAYPTIHAYYNGCVIEITAGTGSNDKQKSLLTNLAQTAMGNLERIMPAEPAK